MPDDTNITTENTTSADNTTAIHWEFPTPEGFSLAGQIDLPPSRRDPCGEVGVATQTPNTPNTHTTHRHGVVLLCHGLLNHRQSHVCSALAAKLLRMGGGWSSSSPGGGGMSYMPSSTKSLCCCRFDFRGNGRSGGVTDYSNYAEEARDIQYVLDYWYQRAEAESSSVVSSSSSLSSTSKQTSSTTPTPPSSTPSLAELYGPVVAVVGHSKAATSVLMWAAQHGEQWWQRRRRWEREQEPAPLTPQPQPLALVCLSGRFDMRATPSTRFTADQLRQLDVEGKFLWKWIPTLGGGDDDDDGDQPPPPPHGRQPQPRPPVPEKRPYYITREALDRRSQLDVGRYARQVQERLLTTGKATMLTVHGTDDAVVPVHDARQFAQIGKDHHGGRVVIVDGMDHFYRDQRMIDTICSLIVQALDKAK